MTNRIALALVLLIAGAIYLDQSRMDGEGAVFLGRKIVDFIDWIAFWR